MNNEDYEVEVSVDASLLPARDGTLQPRTHGHQFDIARHTQAQAIAQAQRMMTERLSGLVSWNLLPLLGHTLPLTVPSAHSAAAEGASRFGPPNLGSAQSSAPKTATRGSTRSAWTAERRINHGAACRVKSKLTLAQKLKIIELHTSQDPEVQMTQAELARMFSKSRSAISKLLRPENIEMLLSMTRTGVNDGSKPRYHCFLPVEVEQCIHDMLIQKFGRDLSLSPGHISGKGKLRIAIMQMAEEVAHKAGVGEWRPSYGWFHRFMKRHGLWDKHLRLRSRLSDSHHQQEQEQETDDEDDEMEAYDEATCARQEDREGPCSTRNLATNPLSSLSMLPPPTALGIEGAQSSATDSLLAHGLLQLNSLAPASLIAPNVPPLGPIAAAQDDGRGVTRGGTQVQGLVAKASLLNAPHQPLVAIGTQGHGWPAFLPAPAPTPLPVAASETNQPKAAQGLSQAQSAASLAQGVLTQGLRRTVGQAVPAPLPHPAEILGAGLGVATVQAAGCMAPALASPISNDKESLPGPAVLSSLVQSGDALGIGMRPSASLPCTNNAAAAYELLRAASAGRAGASLASPLDAGLVTSLLRTASNTSSNHYHDPIPSFSRLPSAGTEREDSAPCSALSRIPSAGTQREGSAAAFTLPRLSRLPSARTEGESTAPLNLAAEQRQLLALAAGLGLKLDGKG